MSGRVISPPRIFRRPEIHGIMQVNHRAHNRELYGGCLYTLWLSPTSQGRNSFDWLIPELQPEVVELENKP
jgi:hypothetical protein